MNPTLLTLTLCTIFLKVIALPPPRDFLGRFPIARERPAFSSPSILSPPRINPLRNAGTSTLSIPQNGQSESAGTFDINGFLQRIRSTMEPLNDSNNFETANEFPSSDSFPKFPSSLPPLSENTAFFRPPGSGILSRTPSNSLLRPFVTSRPMDTSNIISSDYWSPLTCNCQGCTRRIGGSNQNQGSQPVMPLPQNAQPTLPPTSRFPNRSWSSVTWISSSNGPNQGAEPPTEKPPKEPTELEKSPNTLINPPATSQGTTDPDDETDSQEPDTSEGPKEPKVDAANPPEEIPQQSDDSESSENSDENEQTLPKTLEEDKPENWSIEDNIDFVRGFRSDMTKLLKQKIIETVRYLLEKKGNELTTADRAAIEYIITERLSKDPEIKDTMERYRRMKEQERNKNIRKLSNFRGNPSRNFRSATTRLPSSPVNIDVTPSVYNQATVNEGNSSISNRPRPFNFRPSLAPSSSYPLTSSRSSPNSTPPLFSSRLRRQ